VKRAAANLAAGLALLLAVAVPVLWVRSHRVADRVLGTTPGGRYLDLVSVEGGFELRVAPRYPYPEPFDYSTSDTHRRTRSPWYALGFAYRREAIRFMPLDNGPPRIPPAPYWMVRVPYWFLLAWFAAFPAARARALRRARVARRRRERGLCVGCGYDVRATPDPSVTAS
jgi:hypothetical protein